MKYKSKSNIVYSCKYHVVFCPKYRRSVLINGVDVRLKEWMKETCNQLGVEIIEMEIVPDHVHILLEVDPQYGIHKAVKRRKGYSSYVLRQKVPLVKIKTSKPLDALDEQLIRIYSRWCFPVYHQTIY